MNSAHYFLCHCDSGAERSLWLWVLLNRRDVETSGCSLSVVEIDWRVISCQDRPAAPGVGALAGPAACLPRARRSPHCRRPARWRPTAHTTIPQADSY